MGVLLVPRSQDLRNERLKVESCNIHLRQITRRKKCGLQMSWIRRMKCGGARAFNMKRFFHAPICLWEIILNASIRYCIIRPRKCNERYSEWMGWWNHEATKVRDWIDVGRVEDSPVACAVFPLAVFTAIGEIDGNREEYDISYVMKQELFCGKRNWAADWNVCGSFFL